MKTAVILPAYNEEKTIKDVIIDFHTHLPDAEIFVINNNSKDKTHEIALETFKNLKLKGAVLFESRQGKANAVKKAFSEINADLYIMVDADLTYPAQEVHKLIAPVIEGKADMVVGDRISNNRYKEENKRKFHEFGNVLVKKLINVIFKSDLKDIMSGYRVFNKKFAKNYPILVEGFELETDMSLHALDKKFKILEIPIQYKDRPEGSFSKLNTFRDGFRVLKTIVKIYKNYKPLLFFSLFFLFFFIGSLAAGIPVLIEFIKNQFITHIPLAILSTGLAILSLLSLSIGLILATVTQNHRYNYELNLIRYIQNESDKKNS
ncbi:MAG TPA: glycosyl transferase [Spirochaetia bacterium]|nr:glycosyl transferase [Spirochaetia bacterium]